MVEAAEEVLYELGIHNVHAQIVKVLGRLKFRTSYGQNQLRHSKEVARLAGSMATEMGLNVEEAKRAGLLHDVGTAYADNGRFEQAEQLLRRSLAAGGETSSEVRLLLAQVLKSQNKYEVAIKEYQQVLMGGNSSAANKKAAAQGVQDMEKALATNLMKK